MLLISMACGLPSYLIGWSSIKRFPQHYHLLGVTCWNWNLTIHLYPEKVLAYMQVAEYMYSVTGGVARWVGKVYIFKHVARDHLHIIVIYPTVGKTN